MENDEWKLTVDRTWAMADFLAFSGKCRSEVVRRGALLIGVFNRFLDVWSFQLFLITFFVHEMAPKAAFECKFGTLMLNAAPYSCDDKCWQDLNFLLFNSDIFSHYFEYSCNFAALYMLSKYMLECSSSCKDSASSVFEIE